MSTTMRDLWPDDIKSDDVISPEDILDYQARQLESRTNGLLIGRVVRLAGQDRVVLGFEVEAPRAGTRVRLLEAQHRLEYEYPVAIVPPEEELPEFLKDQVYYPAQGDALWGAMRESPELAQLIEKLAPGRWVENEWIATSPTEFSEKVEKVLARPGIKAIVLSLLARSNRQDSGNGDKADES